MSVMNNYLYKIMKERYMENLGVAYGKIFRVFKQYMQLSLVKQSEYMYEFMQQSNHQIGNMKKGFTGKGLMVIASR
jgi:hypothetical protein